MPRPSIACASAVLLVLAAAGMAQAQPKRDFLQIFDVPPGSYEVRMGTSDLDPNRTGGRQSHPGPEAGYVLRGDGTLLVAGQPPQRLKTGQSYKLASGVIHELRSGSQGVTLLITWVVEKGKPFEIAPR